MLPYGAAVRRKMKKQEEMQEVYLKNNIAEGSIVAMMSITDLLYKAMTEKKSFRMEIEYDAEAPSETIRIYQPSEFFESDIHEEDV